MAARTEAFLTGAWLALWQVALGLLLLRGAGGAAHAFFSLTAAWLLGGAIGARLLARRAGSGLLLLALLLGLIAHGIGAGWPFSALALWAPLVAGGVAGSYGGAFIAGRSATWSDAARLLFVENNGFLLGYVGAAGMIFACAPLLLWAGVLLGLLLALRPRFSLVTISTHSALAGVLATALYFCFPWVGDRGWDALMTAAVLARPESVTAREVLFFAHPLVIPLTAPLVAIVGDPLLAAASREALCGGGVVALALLGGHALGGTRRAGLGAALGLLLAVGRWQLATSGEEKEIAQLFGGLFVWLYLDHRGLWDLGLPAWRGLSARTRRCVLGGLLALAAAVHVVNGVLALVLVADLLIERRRAVAREVATVLLVAAACAGPFFLGLALGPGGARTPLGVVHYFLEYHLSGEFLTVPTSLGGRALAAYAGGRAFFVGELPLQAPLRELLLAVFFAILILRSALRTASAPALRLLVWVALLGAHFFFFEPWNPEAWAAAELPLLVLLAAGLLRRGRGLRLRTAVAVLACGALALRLQQTHDEATRAAGPARLLVETPGATADPSPAPLTDLCRYLDARLPREAILLVDERLDATYFVIYTRRRPLVRAYLDQSPAELRRRFALTSLSARFYTPTMTSAQIEAARLAGRPVYLLTADAEAPLVEPLALGWRGLRIGRLGPSVVE